MVWWMLVLMPASTCGQDHDWRGFRGNDGTASIGPDRGLAKGPLHPQVKWKRPLGSGYAGIAITGPRLITAYTDGSHDRLVCLDKSTGTTQWDIAIDAGYRGRDGSFDGPLATPVISGQTVVTLTAQGRLLAVNLLDGTLVWSRRLTEPPINAPSPQYGFSSSPIIVGDIVIVLAGGPGAFATGFELASGQLAWKSGDDEVQCQSAIFTKLAGQQMVVAAGMSKLFGLDPQTGKPWFELPHDGHGARGALSIVPVVVDENRLFIAHDDRASRLYEVVRATDGFVVRPVWTTPAIANTYNVPVVRDQVLYGYNDRILTAVDPGTGNRLWRSREPGDGFHIAVDHCLVVITKRGVLNLCAASNSRFRLLASLPLFDDLVWTPPAYSDHAIYTRSLGEIACIDLLESGSSVTAPVARNHALRMAPGFARWIEAIEQEQKAGPRRQLIDEFVAANPRSPVIEEDIAHFFYRGPARDVALASPLFGSRQERQMQRVGDLFYYALQLPKDQRADYSLFVDFASQADPRNPRPAFASAVFVDEMEIRLATTRDCDPVWMSWFAMPDWQSPDWLTDLELDDRHAMAGRTGEYELSDNSRLDVYLPPGYAEGTQRYPVVYVLDPDARSLGRLDTVADSLIRAARIRPCLLVFLPQKLGEPDILQYPAYLTGTVIPAIDRDFRTHPDREQRTILATGFYAPLAMYVATECQQLFGATGLQSPFILGASAEQVAEKFARLDRKHRVYCEWGRFDLFCPTENWDMRRTAEKLFQAIQQNQGMSIQGGTVNDTTGWQSWRFRMDRVLSTLVGKPE